MAATYHKLNKQEFIIQLGTCASGTLASGGELSGYAALEGELFYVPEYKAVYVGDSSYYLNPSHGTHIACSAITATNVHATAVCATTVCATDVFTTRITGIAWDDIRAPGLAMRTNATAPDLIDLGGGILAYGFAGGGTTEQVYGALQIPHTYKQGTTLHPHVHYARTDTATGSAVWAIDYTVTDIDELFVATARLSAVTSPTSGYGHKYLDLGDISGSGISGVSAMLMFRLFRPSDDSHDDYPSDMALLEFDMHYQVDSLGSDAETTKSY